MFYPTGNTTEGREIIDIEGYGNQITDLQEENEPFLEKVKSWLDEKEYCVEKSQLKKYMKSNGFSEEEIKEMEGGDGGGGFASLGSTPGMGDVSAPSSGGTNSDFYNGEVGSGDVFTSLTVGTGASSKKGKKKKRGLSLLQDFDKFVSSMRKNQGVKKS